MCSCRENSLRLEGTLKGSQGRNLTMVHRASSDKQTFLVHVPLPLSGDKFEYKAVTRYPTVVWITDATGALLAPVWGERGDDISIEGDYSDPWKWSIKGNPVVEEYTRFTHDNYDLLRSGSHKSLNGRLADYVKAHPKGKGTAFLLAVLYDRTLDPEGFARLWDMLDISDRERSRLLNASLIETPPGPAARLKRFSLPDRRDTLRTVDPAAAGATVLYLWGEGYDPRLKKRAGVERVGIFMDLDTMRRPMVWPKEELLLEQNLFALGAQAHPALQELQIPSLPYYIVADKGGNIKYRGTDPAAAERESARLVK